ncbi:MAG: class III signal peptide-containing protein, partial [Hadesarchaea archaeon]
MRGQLSVEFVIIISGLLVILAVVTMPMYNQARADA